MRHYEEDPVDRAFIEKELPFEARSLIDAAEQRMKRSVDGVVSEFRGRIESRIDEFIKQDFSGELEAQVNAELQEILNDEHLLNSLRSVNMLTQV